MITVRPMRQDDIPAVLEIAALCWDRGFAQMAEPSFNAMFQPASWKPFFYVAQEGNQVIGMAGYGVSWLNYGIYNLFWVAVRPARRNRGTGRHLVGTCLDNIAPFADHVMLTTGRPGFYAKHFDFQEVMPLTLAHGGAVEVLMIKNLRPDRVVAKAVP